MPIRLMTSPVLAVLLGALALFLNSCNGPAKPRDGLAVKPTVDASRQVEAAIGIEGGTLQVTGADGALYTLHIPAGALADETTIAMTPISSVEGIPLSGGLQAGVRLLPDGLGLLKAATLEIQPARAITGQVVGFGYSGDGANFHLSPSRAAPTAGRYLIDTLHFSGHGVTSGTSAEIKAQAANPPASAADRVSHDVAIRLHSGAEADSAWFRQEYESVVRPEVERALNSDNISTQSQALQAMINLTRLAALLGLEDDPFLSEEFRRVFKEFTEKQIRDGWRKCVNENDVNGAQIIISALRSAELLGFMDQIEVIDPISECLRFEVDFKSELRVVMTESGMQRDVTATAEANDVVVQGTITDRLKITGKGPLRHLGIKGGYKGEAAMCQPVFGGFQDGVFEVVNLSFGFGGIGSSGSDTASNVGMTLVPGEIRETETVACGGAPARTFPTTWWPVFFNWMHKDDAVYQYIYGVALSRGEGAHFASRSWSRTFACLPEGAAGQCTENTTMTVYHRPKRSGGSTR